MRGKDERSDLGRLGRDKVTGHEGIILSRCLHLYGEDTLGLAVHPGPNVKPDDIHWFDAKRIEIVGQGMVPPINS